MNERRVIELIEELDKLVPKEGARIILNQYGGGPDESEISGNVQGYLRFGIELMKGAFVDPQDKRKPTQIFVDLDELISEDSAISFDCFYRHPEVAESAVPNETLGGRISLYIILTLFLSVLLLAAIGLFMVVRWLIF